MSWAAVDLSIIGPAFLAGLIVLATHVPLGQRVLKRGIIFIDLAVAQIAGLGVIAAYSLSHDPGDLIVQAAAFSAAIIGAALLYFTERRWPEVQEALIGTAFILAATGAILLLADNPHGGEHLKDLLVGQILWVDPQDLWRPALISLLVLLVWRRFRNASQDAVFYALFAVAVTASVQLVGVYLVFASLIIPALASYRLSGIRKFVVAYGVGVLGFAAGLILSALLDLPTGPLIVWCLAATAILSVVSASSAK